MINTSDKYDSIIEKCRDIFVKKMKDYGTSWRILRLGSITDQVFIKGNRVRTLQEKGISKVDEGIQSEFMAIVNYSIMAQIQIEIGASSVENAEMETCEVEVLYDKYTYKSKDLMEAKNHDYGEAWRDMRISSLTDLILVKLLRIKQIEDNEGQTLISEGISSNYYDILNYSVFALIKLEEVES